MTNKQNNIVKIIHGNTPYKYNKIQEKRAVESNLQFWLAYHMIGDCSSGSYFNLKGKNQNISSRQNIFKISANRLLADKCGELVGLSGALNIVKTEAGPCVFGTC